MQIRAYFYDGKSSLRKDVVLTFQDDKKICINGEDINFDTDFDKVEISSRLGKTARIFTFENGFKCESFENDKIDTILKEQFNHKELIHSLENKTINTIISVLIAVIFITLFFLYGNATIAKSLAYMLPQNLETEIGSKILETLDKKLLKPSTLDINVKKHIEKDFKKIIDNKKGYTLHFRRGIGANAFALPSKDIIITDELIELSDNDYEAIIGVLAHEIGHVHNKHSLRLLIQGSIVTAFISLISGDVSSLVTFAPILLIQSKYSRALELEADLYAKNKLREMGLSTLPLAKMFEKLEAQQNIKIPKYLSTHPISKDRIEALK